MLSYNKETKYWKYIDTDITITFHIIGFYWPPTPQIYIIIQP